MKELKKELENLLKNSNADHTIIESIKKDRSISPFCTEGRIMAYLLSIGKISYNDYLKLSRDYCVRHQQENQYLELFDMAPRTFGQTWGEQHINKLFPQFLKATKENLASLYPSFAGEFDLWFDGIRVEVKACRANSTNTKGSLASRAYSYSEAKTNNFKYHYGLATPNRTEIIRYRFS